MHASSSNLEILYFNNKEFSRSIKFLASSSSINFNRSSSFDDSLETFNVFDNTILCAVCSELGSQVSGFVNSSPQHILTLPPHRGLSALTTFVRIYLRSNAHIDILVRRHYRESALLKSLKSSSRSYILESSYKLNIPNITLPEFLTQFHNKFEKLTAVECSETKRKYTYGELRNNSTNLAKSLVKILKLHDGDVVAIVLSNIPEFPIANLGVQKANLISTTISTVFTPDEISRQLVNSNAKAIITDVDLTPTIKKALQISSKILPIITVKTRNGQSLPESTIDFHELVNALVTSEEIKPCNPENVAFLPYSSGTTGLPKGVQLSHKNLVSNIMQINHPELDIKTEASETFQEIIPCVLPMYHVFGHNVVMNSMPMCGGKMITLSKYNPESFISMLRDYRNTIFYTVPPLALMLAAQESVKKEYLESLKIILTGAAPLALSDQRRFSEKFGNHIKFLQGYGLSECTSVSTFLYPKSIKNRVSYEGSSGEPIANTSIKIVDIEDPTNTPLGPNTIGELLIKGPQVMKGYWNLPEETSNTITEDGWLRTGDVCKFNEDGFCFIVDRYKELIKVKGNQVPPAELEAVIRTFPGVDDVAVIGIPHEKSGEVPRAYVVAKSGLTIDTKKLNEFVNEKVAKYKYLKGGISVVDNIPKNGSGKILRRQLKDGFLKNGV
ncbi:hypothetical protein WA026_013919 [Henosepilachna vigintioctopunctata]|uniref:4-coumarate--CoA ligase n=1 Tax=Henosepilachna vigintioctopunctata TaxID=420089 RepID=A0AAW1U948_9CUCU